MIQVCLLTNLHFMLKLTHLLTLLVCYCMVLQDTDFHLWMIMSCCGSAGLSPVWRNAVFFGSKVMTADTVITFIEHNHAAFHILINNSKNINKPMWRHVENITISVALSNSWKRFCQNRGSWNGTNKMQMSTSVQLLKKKFEDKVLWAGNAFHFSLQLLFKDFFTQTNI